MSGHRRTQLAQQAQDRPHPGALLVGGEDVPGHRDGGAAIQNTHDQGDDLVTMRGGVNGESQGVALPPTEQPAQQGGKAQADIELGATGGGLVGAIVEPFAQALAQAVPGTPREQGGEDGRFAGTLGEDRAIAPQGQAALLGGAQVGQVVSNGGFHLIPWFSSGHKIPPACRLFAPPMMPEVVATLVRNSPLPPLVSRALGEGARGRGHSAYRTCYTPA